MSFEFKVSDLKEEYLDTTTPGDNPDKKSLDSKLFNRNESYEVATMINNVLHKLDENTPPNLTPGYIVSFLSKQKLLKEIGNKLEDVIKDELPDDVRSSEKVADFLYKKAVVFYENK
ncbi:hypothetical protein [Phocoenobacter skyensis]|uniref:Uncharacterized protein n=1 Tax=Phocoenobacter skyensis TaxID=97481 RepID=A0A1H7U298_9PAST|nr:hypothetical protein [Pasteurella skyensis]MDP8078720.1 hypothetical protein [Pasteurella skyensis]MDP8084714.1 hypothetical protein [Pasteurella skyensis]MDP8184140.1 hypothetical protein [Pasteurella skyensis]QLB22799.1 hypothetical protein A6B44_06080 [Pasteurella skyensis]SEL91073.1 hypothetical protein SAMN05444853_101128 [Pasteurella skyensis]